MSSIWQNKIVAINPLKENNEITGYAIVSKEHKHFYGSNIDLDQILKDVKGKICFDDPGEKYNFRALYYQLKPNIKFQNISDIVKQEYYTTDVKDTLYFVNREGAKQAVVEACFMLEFFKKNYKERNEKIYFLDKNLLKLTSNYESEISINKTQLRTDLSLYQKKRWDIERELFEKVGYPIQSQFSIDDSKLRESSNVAKALDQIKNYKSKVDYLEKYLNLPKIVLNFDITATSTGRILCRDRQNDIGLFAPDKNYRNLFPAKKGFIFISADYKRQEACILAEISKDEQLKQDIQDDDFYSRLARWTIRETKKQIGKTLFYAVIYGAKSQTVAEELKIDIDTIKSAIKKIKNRYKNLSNWLEDFNESTNYFGRPLHNNTVNAYVQSTAADILKDRLLATFNYGPALILSDNVIYQTRDVDIQRKTENIKLLLQSTLPFNLEVEIKTSYNLS